MTFSTPVPLSVFIITKDESDRIGDTIKSVIGWADEVIVVDSGSCDDTVKIAKEAGARVIYNAFSGYGPQKKFAEKRCKNQWLLNIDADEPLSIEAQEEIKPLLTSGKIADFDCWRILIRTIYPHEKKPAPWAFSYNQVRLYDSAKLRFSDSIVHDSVTPREDTRVGQLEGVITHFSHRSLNFQVTKFNRYSEMQADDLIARGKRLGQWRLITEFPLAFLKAYFLRRHILYGVWGFCLSVSYAYSRFLRVAKFYEKELQKKAGKIRQK